MRRILIIFMLSALLTSAAWAADDSLSSDDATLSSTAEATETTRGYLNSEVIGMKPQVGVLIFKDQLANSSVRAVYGATVDANLAPGFNAGWSNFFFGPSTGVIYSHLGDPGSNLVGTNSDIAAGAASANLVVIPANLKVGYNFNERFRLSAHGGGNAVYRSVSSSLFLGDSSAVGGSVWRLFPNVGGDIELGIGKHAALMLRPDWTITPGDTFFTGTLAFSIPIG